MKIAAKSVKEAITYPQRYHAALIYGVDEGQVRLLTRQMSENFMGKDADTINRIEFNASQIEDDPARLADELASFSLLGGKRAIIIRDGTDKIASLLDEALRLRAPDNFLIIASAEALPARSKLRSYFERGDQLAAIACYKDEGASLAQLIRETLNAYGIKANRQVMDYLTQQLQGDRQVVLNELEKISLYLGEEAKEITMEEALLLTADSRETSLDALCEACASNNKVALCRMVDTLLAEGMQPVVMIRSVSRYLKRIEEVAQKRYDGAPLDAAIDALRPPIFFKQKAAFRNHAARFSLSKLQDAFHELYILELTTKREGALTRPLLSAGLLRIAAMAGTGASAGAR